MYADRLQRFLESQHSLDGLGLAWIPKPPTIRDELPAVVAEEYGPDDTHARPFVRIRIFAAGPKDDESQVEVYRQAKAAMRRLVDCLAHFVDDGQPIKMWTVSHNFNPLNGKRAWTDERLCLCLFQDFEIQPVEVK